MKFEGAGFDEFGAGPHGLGAFWHVNASGGEAWAEGSWTVTAN